jgi:nitrous oxidase accessory protein NosD
MKPSLLCTTVSVLAAIHLYAAEAQTDFDLQTAIDNASSGDTLVIPAGTYTQPITIDKKITLDGPGAILKVQSQQPAIQIDTAKPVVLRNLEIQYRTETKPQQGESPYAVTTSGGDLRIEECVFKATGTSDQSPCAVQAIEASTLHIKRCRFDGFNFTIQIWMESEGLIEDCLIMNPGHCGITIGENSKGTLRRNIVTGSRYHGIRCTGGEINADSNLVVANKNRGFYIGNKSATGTLSNNLIVDNATGIDVFAFSTLDIHNNVIVRSSYAGLSLIDTAKVDTENNIFVKNERGVIGYSAEKGKDPGLNLRGENIAYDNATQTEGIKLPSELIGIDPQFEDPDSGLFAAKENAAKEMGLTNPPDLQVLWKTWQAATIR